MHNVQALRSLLLVLKQASKSNIQGHAYSWKVPQNCRGYASREELLQRLKHAKLEERQHEKAVVRTFWEDRRTYIMLTALVLASAWGYSVLAGHSITDKAFLDVSIGGQHAGRIVVGIHGNSVPKTALNFMELVTHGCGYGYRGSCFHQVMPKMAVLAGDITKGDGTGGMAALGPSLIKENSPLRHVRGTVSMFVDEDGLIRSQFFICCCTSPWLNSKSVAFGSVLEGMEVVEKISQLPTDGSGRPRQDVRIEDCGSSSTEPSPFLSSLISLWTWMKGDPVPTHS
ncbi:hypothetical protein CEUSTIGMA_g10979.t1 [Chlamydomonas eustigma]|uniref:Peptidyl-prolyl cis-trans isomerase n=1 Tax=Chlamydomonas eustigma TaxID=1157962 RepID=A0A250XKF5_9CHLO|nr:hypothetical protein CEUSTIGMA_g10979.t1 [Chlamydomonas eustigma]|eukprot:GAX83554.1 hypothetical protein CEUSTIGMA_g10979.t1 [Chlamydomonas eustigma]